MLCTWYDLQDRYIIQVLVNCLMGHSSVDLQRWGYFKLSNICYNRQQAHLGVPLLWIVHTYDCLGLSRTAGIELKQIKPEIMDARLLHKQSLLDITFPDVIAKTSARACVCPLLLVSSCSKPGNHGHDPSLWNHISWAANAGELTGLSGPLQ